MILSDLWWNQINSSVRYVNLLKDSLSDERNILIFCREVLPWKHSLYKRMKTEIGEVSATRSIEFIRCESGISPGKIVLNCLSSPDIQANYWPGQAYAEYLSSVEDSMLNDRFIWVKNISTENDASAWLEFVNDYNKYFEQYKSNQKRAVFILECCGNFSFETKAKNFSTIDITPSDFDRYMFCIMTTSELNCSYALKQYISEVAFNLGGCDLEICGKLALSGLGLIENPLNVYFQVCEEVISDSSKQVKSETQVNSDILVSQMKMIFPVLEQKRQLLIQKYKYELEMVLPIKNTFNEIVTEPYELELSVLLLLANQYQIQMSSDDKKLLRFCRDIRNKIAHNEILMSAQIKNILG